jgi:hypothetical protein
MTAAEKGDEFPPSHSQVASSASITGSEKP